jgi:hypothetical protein
VYVATVVPVRIGFDLEDDLGWKIWGYILDAAFTIDIVLTFFTS